MEKATFGAGCFWGVEETFRKVRGVKETAVGYMGGHTESPTYEDVCTDTTGHAEVVHMDFDPEVVPYDRLLDIFWEMHDPTTRDRQGLDVGKQYRSVIFYHTAEQKRTAERSRERVEGSGKWNRKVVTQVVEAGNFWRAEEYHQKYLLKNGLENCHVCEPSEPR